MSQPARVFAAIIALLTFVALGVQFAATAQDHPDHSAFETAWRLARFYTDIGLLTARDDMTREVAEVFNLLTARSAETFRTLMVAPTTLMSGMLHRIDREIEHARAGRPAAIVAISMME